MGNKLTKKFIKSSFKKINTHNDDFIINHSKKNRANDLTDIKTFDERRKVFISLLGLYQSWQNCPSNVLYSAIFILPLKSTWIYSPTKYITELQNCQILQSSVFSDIFMVKTFIEMLRWKDKQGLIIFMLDDYETNQYNNNIKYDELMHPVWHYISYKFNQLKLNKLNLDTDWWKNEAKTKTTKSEILSEFYFMWLKFKTMKEIINESNPDSLHVIEYYNCNIYEKKRTYTLCKLNAIENNDTEDDINNWWISSEYDPYDL